MKSLFLAALMLAVAPHVAAVNVGDTLPELDIPEKGELIMENDQVDYRPWSTRQIKAGQPAILFHLAARLSADAIIKPLTNRLEAEQLDPEKHQAITIVNLGDAMWGTAGLVGSELEKNKKKHPEAAIVADDSGRGIKTWSLPRKTVTILVLDPNNEIIHRHDGEMNEQDIEKIVRLLKEQIQATS